MMDILTTYLHLVLITLPIMAVVCLFFFFLVHIVFYGIFLKEPVGKAKSVCLVIAFFASLVVTMYLDYLIGLVLPSF